MTNTIFSIFAPCLPAVRRTGRNLSSPPSGIHLEDIAKVFCKVRHNNINHDKVITYAELPKIYPRRRCH